MDHVGTEVKRLRIERGWTQPELAVSAGIAVSGLSQIENGHRNASSRTMSKLATALGVEMADLFPKAEAPSASGQYDTSADRAWVEAYAGVGRELLRGWERQEQRWDRWLKRFVNRVSEERRLSGFSRPLLFGYSAWVMDTSRAVQSYVEGILGQDVVGIDQDLDQICKQMFGLYHRISGRARSLLVSAAGEEDSEIQQFREQLEALEAPAVEDRHRQATSNV